MQRKTNTILVGLGLIVACILVSGFVGTESVSAYTASITTNNSISFDISPSGDGTSIHSESINVQSDCRAGYNLTIATPQGSNLYKNGSSVNGTSFTSVDGTSALNSSNNTNKWGYTLTANPTSSTVFLPLSPTQAVLKTPSQTASPSADINDTFDINYGAQVSNSVDAGNYQMANQGAIVYYLTMDTTCTQYTVTFNANGGTGTIDNQGIETGEPTKLTSADSLTAPTGASYTDAGNNTITGTADKLWTFWGWNTQIDGSGDWYKDKEEVEDLANVGSTITLYAQWKQATLADMVVGTQVGTEKIIDHNEMQDMRPEVCWNSDITTSANAPAATLLDYRGKVTTGDNPESAEQYTVSKLADGNCWMTKNLNLGRNDNLGPNNNGTITLTSEDTDLADNTTFTLPKSTTTSNTTATAATIRTTNNSSNNNNGTYYSWAAAVANTTSISTNPTTSVCPKNWDLPTDAMYTNLSTESAYTSSNQTTAAPSSFLINGGFTNGASFYQTSYSHFWTNRSSSTTAAYGARINSTTMTISNSTGTTYGGNKYYRKNIRCVTSQGRVTINYNGNGTAEYPVTGATASQENIELSTNPTTRSSSFTRTDWDFTSWNTAADGSGTSIVAGASISALNLKPGETITLYAQWNPQYTITYVNNCMNWASSNANCTASTSATTSEQKISLANNPSNGAETGTLAASNKWTITDWKITGWTTNADGSGTEYRASSTYTVPAGSSVGSGITLYAHWVPVYSIQYDGNGADNPNGMGTTDQSTGVKSVKQINVSQGDPVTLLASNFKKAGYGFAGWSTSPTATIGGSDKIYGPMETIDAPAYPNNGANIITMYAVWVEAEKDGNDNPIYLQDFTTSDCNALTSANFNTSTGTITPGSVIALTDKRDNQVYAVAKLADNNCWMIENLRLGHDGAVGNNTNDNSVTNQSLSQGYGGTPGAYGNFVGLANPESANFNNTTTLNSIYKSSAALPTDSYNGSGTLEDIGSNNSPGYRFPRYNDSNTLSLIDSTTYTQNYGNTSSPSGSGAFSESNLYSYGNYYTWAAAMASTNYYSESSDSEAAGTSICPANWHLPSSNGTTKEYGMLSQSYGGSGDNQAGTAQSGDIMSNRFRTFPNNYLYSGNYYYSSVTSWRSKTGYYWSRSAYSYDSAYFLSLSSTDLYSSIRGFDRFHGFTIRCLINTSMAEIILDNNDSTGSATRIYDTPGNTINLPQLSREGFKAKSWNTVADGSGIEYTTSYTIASGSSGVTLYAQWKPTYSIQYDGNGADNPNGMGTTDGNGVKSVKQINVGEGDSVTLLASNFKRAGYGFAGWSTDPDAWAHFTDNDNTNDPTIYGPTESVIIDPSTFNSLRIVMYAVWAEAEKDGNNSPIYLQDFTTNDCNTLTKADFNASTGIITPGSVIALTDKRDNQVYTVAKLADDNCWMIENLRLNNQYTMGQNQNDSSVTNESLAQGYGGTIGTYGNFVGLANSESTNFSNSTTANSIYKSSAASPTDTYNPANNVLEDIGTSSSPGYRFPRYNNKNTTSPSNNATYTQNYINATNPIDGGINNYRTDSNLYSYGNYYTWAAAMANTNYYGDSFASEAAGTSICPTNWHLPSSNGPAKEYGSLSQSYGGNGNNQSGVGTGDLLSNRFRAFPNNFLYSGILNSSSAVYRGTYGYYLSRSASGGSNSFNLYMSSTYFYPSNNYFYSNLINYVTKSFGYSVRCLIGS